jgi:hypothetical protein
MNKICVVLRTVHMSQANRENHLIEIRVFLLMRIKHVFIRDEPGYIILGEPG